MSMRDLIGLVGQVCGAEVDVLHFPAQAGDVCRTGGAIDVAGALLGWRPEVGVREGVEAQTRWQASQCRQPSLARGRP
jgi:UDP-glucose 4-epimerase